MNVGGISRFVRNLLARKVRGTTAAPLLVLKQTIANGAATQLYIPSVPEEPLRQGEILASILEIRLASGLWIDGAEASFEAVTHPLAIVLSQDCDLTQDFNVREIARQNGQELDLGSDKLLPSTLFCDLEDAEDFLSTAQLNSKEKKRIRQNREERYQYLRTVPASNDSIGAGLPALAVDFKHYFAVPTSDVYAQLKTGLVRRCRLANPYLEHFSARFSNYLSRVALPEDNEP